MILQHLPVETSLTCRVIQLQSTDTSLCAFQNTGILKLGTHVDIRVCLEKDAVSCSAVQCSAEVQCQQDWTISKIILKYEFILQ